MPRKSKHPADAAVETGTYFVAIGASAGGLEAINEFFDNVPSDTGFSFIVIQHLSPDYKSLMAELLSKHTTMQVIEAGEDMPLKPNCIYLIPTKKILTLKGGKLQLEEKVRNNHPNTTIDIFFESLAKDKKEKAVGIILSGTGSDGSRGIAAIKACGGTVIVQDPTTAEFDGMPNSAITTGLADLITAPGVMPDEMLHFLKEAPMIGAFTQLNNQEEAIITDTLDLIYRITQHDFTHYKRPTLHRLLAKRMAEKGIPTLADYYNFLADHPEEVKALCKEFLINVTRFFRDEDAFEVIRTQVIPSLFAAKVSGDTIKVWVVAASTGEEAYTLSMLFEEYIESTKRFDISVKIFATDVDQHAIDIASKGVYTAEALKAVSSERVKKFFVKEGNTYKVSPALRKTVVFARHDITKDPPFSRIDLLTCRNMLIYMNTLLQRSILQRFHFALNEDGYLFLGSSENIGILNDVMKDVDKKWKIYRCISKTKTGEYDTFLNPVDKANSHLPSPKAKNALSHLSEIFKETLLDEYPYAGILIDKDFEVKQAIGAFKNFMSFPEGSFNFNLLKLVPSDLAVALSTCIRRAIKDNDKIVQKKVKVDTGKKERSINIVVKPYLTQKNYLQPFLFIVLSENEQEAKPSAKTFDPSKKEFIAQRIEELENELKDTKENLQAVIEEVESANEELQSSNEEIISSNEELQSTNEELQSLNEELHTVNAEHQQKIKELMELNDDLNNYFNNSEVGQILIDENLMVRKFTPFAKRQVNLIDGDIGRSITDLSMNFRSENFIGKIRNVMKTGQRHQEEISMSGGNTFLMRIAPFLRQDKAISGVVVNFVDISQVNTLNSILAAILDSSTSGILAKKAIRNKNNEIVDFEYISVNRAAELMLHMKPYSLVGKRLKKSFPELGTEHFHKYVEVVEKDESRQFEVYFAKLKKWFDIVCVKMMDGLVTTFTDITERKNAADLLASGYEELKVTTSQLERSNMDLLQFASVASHDLKEPLRKIQAFGNILKEKVKVKLDDSEYKYIDKMINSSNRMQNLVDDILTLSRLSNTEIPFVETDLNDIVHKITDDLEITINEKNAIIETSNLPVIKAVPGQMHQLFQNLIANGLKFNAGKRPLIKVKLVPLSDKLAQQLDISSKKFLCIEVEDDGIGFEQKYAEKIFGIFQRLDGNTYQGSGIGLAICKKIMDNHNGYIIAQSSPGEGATFSLIFPR